MKALAAFVSILAAAIANAEIHVDGSGFFPVVVQVIRPADMTPVAGATVRLDKLPPFHDATTDPAKRRKVLPRRLGQPVKTDDEGVAVVFYHGSWADQGEKSARSFVGEVVVEVAGREVKRLSLREWAKAQKFPSHLQAAPHVVIEVLGVR